VLISAKIIKNPRKKWRCDECTKVIEGEEELEKED